MELRQLRCFVAVAEELHFGRAAARANMLPSALGRHVQLLEASMGTRLFARTTRSVALTRAGEVLLTEASALLQHANDAMCKVRECAQAQVRPLRIGVFDSVANGLLPGSLSEFRRQPAGARTSLVEDRCVRLLPMLLAGKLDLAFVRPPVREPGVTFERLLDEVLFVALPEAHPLCACRSIEVAQLAEVPLILPPRRARPKSHALVMQLFGAVGRKPRVAQEIEEKRTAISLVGAGVGAAVVPDWVARMGAAGVAWRPLVMPGIEPPPGAVLGMAWLTDQCCPERDGFIAVVRDKLASAGRTLSN